MRSLFTSARAPPTPDWPLLWHNTTNWWSRATWMNAAWSTAIPLQTIFVVLTNCTVPVLRQCRAWSERTLIQDDFSQGEWWSLYRRVSPTALHRPCRPRCCSVSDSPVEASVSLYSSFFFLLTYLLMIFGSLIFSSWSGGEWEYGQGQV